MFSLKENDEIGSYLAKLVEEKRHESMRQFAREYLKLANEDTDKPSVDKLCNRLSQIKKGAKGIQLKDLPIFTHLLDVTCEELLSAGEYRVPNAGPMTVAQFAASHSRAVWEEFMAREDKLFLNTDEFGKTAIDYALENKNYDLLVYLMKKGYIYFIGPDSKDYCGSFMGGTTIQRKGEYLIDDLDCKLRERDRFRQKLIAMAIEQNDFKMLTEMHARELPTMYQPHFSALNIEYHFDATALIEQITKASDQILDYFSQEFEVQPCCGNAHTFTAPFLGAILERLVEQHHPCTEAVLKRAIVHNQNTLEYMERGIEEVAAIHQKNPVYACTSPEKEFTFFTSKYDPNIICFYHVCTDGSIPSCVTNILSVNASSEDLRISHLIEELNTSYHKIMEIKDKIDKE